MSYKPDRAKYKVIGGPSISLHMPRIMKLETFLVLAMLALVATVLVKVATFFMQGDIPGVFAGGLSIAWAWTCIQAARLVKEAP
jgi:hypothetical protein